MNLRRSVATGALVLTTLATAGPLASVAGAQTDPTPSSTVPAVDCNQVGNQYLRVARRLNMAQNRLAFWQRVAAEMPARIETQKATVADLETQLAAATGDAATALQTQLDQAKEKLAWMEAKLDASTRRVPFWTDYVAKVTARLATVSDAATGATCTLPTTTTIPFDTSLPAGERPPHAEGRDHHGEHDGSTTTIDPTAPTTTEAPETEDHGPDGDGEHPHGTPSTTVPGNAAAQAQAEAARRAADAQRRLAEAQRRAAERQQRRSSSTTAEQQQAPRPPRPEGGRGSSNPSGGDSGQQHGGDGQD